MRLLTNLTIFGIIAMASKEIGGLVSRFRLPLITGYLLLGMLAGPYVLGLIPEEAGESLRFIDEIALAFIAFAAGSELYLNELRSRMKSIQWITTGLVVFTFTLGTLATFLVSPRIPFLSGMPASGRLAASLLAGVILMAISPSSAIAIVNEMRARGSFTKTALGVTVVMDVIVILLFAIVISIAEALEYGHGFDLSFLMQISLELGLAILMGFILGKLLERILSLQTHLKTKIGLILTVGYGVFALSALVLRTSEVYFSRDIFIEPLLICMIGSFIATNWGNHRDEFIQIIEQASPAIYIMFFTLTGASLRMDILLRAWPIALFLFTIRLIGRFLGTFSGGLLAGDPPRFYRLGWMAFVTQAGVGLGLAKNVADDFPNWGPGFATIMIAVIVLNQLVGPPLFKSVIRRVKESHLPPHADPDEIKDALILGIEPQSLALTRQLKEHGWKVILADTDRSHVQDANENGEKAHWLTTIDKVELGKLIDVHTDALIAMLGNDDLSYRATEIAYENFGIRRLIVRLNDMTSVERFSALGAMVVNPATAMVNMLDQFVRAPQSTALLLHYNPDYEVLQVQVCDRDLEGMPLRDLRLPSDVLVIGVTRNGHAVVPHGYTVLHLEDEVSLIGNPVSLEQVALRFGN